MICGPLRVRATRIAVCVGLVTLAGSAPTRSQPEQTTTVHLEGVVTETELHSYLDVPFDVPEGVVEIAVAFEYDTRDERTVLDLGLWSPTGFRGWSGGSRSSFTVSEQSATPGYLAGPLVPGSWRLVIGVPNIRPGVRASYTASVELRPASGLGDERAGPDPAADPTSPSAGGGRAHDGPGWYRGDLHLHTEHSDGSCLVDGARRPCPLERTVDAARRRGLDFIAITEHNTVSHVPWLPEEDVGLTVLPGQEVTTFRGHLSVIGISQRLAFRHTDGTPRDLNEIAAEAQRLGALVVINHPTLPSGEACMGCGWRPLEPTLEQVHAVEVVNGGVIKTRGGAAEGLFSGIPFWERALSAGRGWSAIGASDNHDPDLPPAELGALGRPLTGVWARSAAADDLLEGLRAGRSFVDVEGHPARWLDVTLQASGGGARAVMGGMWNGPRQELDLRIDCGDCAALRAHLRIGTASVAAPPSIDLGHLDTGTGLRHRLEELPADARWLRVDLRAPDGRLVVLGNAIRLDSLPSRPARRPDGAANR